MMHHFSSFIAVVIVQAAFAKPLVERVADNQPTNVADNQPAAPAAWTWQEVDGGYVQLSKTIPCK